MYIFTERQVFSSLPFLGGTVVFFKENYYYEVSHTEIPEAAGFSWNAYVLGRMHTGAKALPVGEASYNA